MAFKREESFVLGFWNYNDYVKGGAQDVHMWKDLGLNVAMAPLFCGMAEIEAGLPSFLDTLHENNICVIPHIA